MPINTCSKDYFFKDTSVYVVKPSSLNKVPTLPSPFFLIVTEGIQRYEVRYLKVKGLHAVRR